MRPSTSPTSPRISTADVIQKFLRGEPLNAEEIAVAERARWQIGVRLRAGDYTVRPDEVNFVDRINAMEQASAQAASPMSPGLSPIAMGSPQPFYSPGMSPNMPGSPGFSPQLSPSMVRTKYQRGLALTPNEMRVAVDNGIIGGPVSPGQNPLMNVNNNNNSAAVSSRRAASMGPSAVNRNDRVAMFFATHQPIEVISGIRIYDINDLPVVRGSKGFQKFIMQPYGRLEHIFVQEARRAIDDRRADETRDPGLSPTIEMDLAISAGVFALFYREFYKGEQDTEFYMLAEELIALYRLDVDAGVTNFIKVGRRRESSSEFITNEVIPFVTDAYRQLGFDRTYFGFVNLQNPYVMAKMGKIPLRADTFEAFAFFDRAPDAYAALNGKLTSQGARTSCFGSAHRWLPLRTQGGWSPMRKMGGWKKLDLFNAIKSSGLLKDVTQLKRFGRQKQTMGITFKDLGIPPSGRDQMILPGFASTPYLALCYYETIYRKIFSTLDFINWPLLCKLNAVSLEGIRTIAIEHYDANPAMVANASIGDICAFVGEQSRKRLELTEELALTLAREAQTTQQGFTHRPGSRWVAPPTMQLMAGGQTPIAPNDDYRMYLRIKAYCEDDTVTKENLIGYTIGLRIRDMLPENLDTFTKADICDHLLDILLPRAEKYEAILFDCSDPAIKVRHILNAANTMGLGAIFPKDITRLTKERACEIITNYIALLQQATAPTVAQTMGDVERNKLYFAGINLQGNSPAGRSPSGSLQ